MQSTNPSVMPEPAMLPSLQRLELEHGLYARRLEKLQERAHLTELEKVEEVRLKKLKLHLKDEMERMRRLGLGPSAQLYWPDIS